jgi:hypothetical protein
VSSDLVSIRHPGLYLRAVIGEVDDEKDAGLDWSEVRAAPIEEIPQGAA